MSIRLARTVVRYISRIAEDAPPYLLIEGIATSLAEDIARSWSAEMPPLLIGSDNPSLFGALALGQRSATDLRNSSANGACIILCNGYDATDAQSISQFKQLTLTDLITTPYLLAYMATAVEPPLDLDGPLRHVRQAILTCDADVRPNASAVADYFDVLSFGGSIGRSLPLLGGFEDSENSEGLTDTRILDNLRLARSVFDIDALNYERIRARAQDVLVQHNRPLSVEVLIRRLEADDHRLLTEISFNEAREIFEERPADLPTIVRAMLGVFRVSNGQLLLEESERELFDKAVQASTRLTSAVEKKDAARFLLDYDAQNAREIFDNATRKKLEQLARDRTVTATNDDLLAGLVIAMCTINGRCSEIRVSAKSVPPDNFELSKSSRQQQLTLVLAAFYAGPMFRYLEEHFGVAVDAMLLMSPKKLVSELPQTSFEDLFGSQGSEKSELSLPALRLRVIGNSKIDSIELKWTPSVEDLAGFAATWEFAERPALQLVIDKPINPRSFCNASRRGRQPLAAANEKLAAAANLLARDAMEFGLSESILASWILNWARNLDEASSMPGSTIDSFSLAGSIIGGNETVVLTVLAPLKTEWYLQRTTQLRLLIEQLFNLPIGDGDPGEVIAAVEEATLAIARASATNLPAFIRLSSTDRALLPVAEGRVWSCYSTDYRTEPDQHAEDAIERVVRRLIELQPEIAQHLKCICYGPSSSTAFLRKALDLLDSKVGGVRIKSIEMWCVADEPDTETLQLADTNITLENRGGLRLRYFSSFDELKRSFPSSDGSPIAHLCIVTGLSAKSDRINVSFARVAIPKLTAEILFTPRTWLPAESIRRMILMPPVATEIGIRWLRLNSIYEGESWPGPSGTVSVPEIRNSTRDLKDYLFAAHELALWVATVDRYASRETLEWAMGPDVAILHQESRLGGSSSLGMVISQRSGGGTDRAIARSLKAAAIVPVEAEAMDIGRRLRESASQGYGVLALEAATSGSGVNELVAHVVAFSLLGTHASPWPLPPGCRILLISLDEYGSWFDGKRADLMALALDPLGGGVHVAVIEVKARRSDGAIGQGECLEQIKASLVSMRYAVSQQVETINCRLWLNRITEAAYSVAREIGFRLEPGELEALERFREGEGILEWAGLGLVFGPNVVESRHDHAVNILGDRVPIPILTIKLTRELLEQAVQSKLTELRTVETEIAYPGGRKRRRPESNGSSDAGARGADVSVSGLKPESPAVSVVRPPRDLQTPFVDRHEVASEGGGPAVETVPAPIESANRPLILGWHAGTESPVQWSVHGDAALLPNGHIEIFGSSGSGKTQFIKALLAQLRLSIGANFCITDFKNDYSDDFPSRVTAEYYDLWSTGAPYNPLALEDRSPRTLERSVIELRDTVGTATKTFVNMGARQQAKLKALLSKAYEFGIQEGRWPTLKTLHDMLDDDLKPLLQDLTEYNLFKQGESLGSIVDTKNVIFGLSQIPGNGMTTVLAAGFILSSLLMRVQSMLQVANSVRYVVVVDEAHRVKDFKAIDTMVREGRSKGLATFLATQQPNDLPEVVASNAQTKICFRLPDAMMARAAAKRLNPSDRHLEDEIRTLGVGEAIVSLGGSDPLTVRLIQFWRDAPLFTR